MNARCRFINRVVKEHDNELFAKELADGKICIYRKSKRYEAFEHDGCIIYNVVKSPQFVFALTDDWTFNGSPREWGGEVVSKRIREHDIQSNERLFEQLEIAQEKAAQSKERAFKNQTEAYLYDHHSQIKKAWSDIRYANMDMRKGRRAEKKL